MVGTEKKIKLSKEITTKLNVVETKINRFIRER